MEPLSFAEGCDMMIELCRSDRGDDIDITTSLRGIGEKTATNFLVEMGGYIRKFKDHKNDCHGGD
jgi:hypothetical protein